MTRFEKSFKPKEGHEDLQKLFDDEVSENKEFADNYYITIKTLLLGAFSRRPLDLDEKKRRLDNLLSSGKREEAQIEWEEIQNAAKAAREALNKKIIKNKELEKTIIDRLIPIELLVANYAHEFEK